VLISGSDHFFYQFIQPRFFPGGGILMDDVFFDGLVQGFLGFFEKFLSLGIIAFIDSFPGGFNGRAKLAPDFAVLFGLSRGYPHVLFGRCFNWHDRFTQVQNAKLKVQS
jgi:hypothetical protein